MGLNPNDEVVTLLMMIQDLELRLNEKDLAIKNLKRMVLNLVNRNDLQRKEIEDMKRLSNG